MLQSDSSADRAGPFEKLWARTLEAPDRVRSFVELLPKVELHAHLNGSISPTLINHLIRNQAADAPNGATGVTPTAETLRSLEDPKSRMDYCFGVFDTIYSVVQTVQATRLVVQDALLHYAAERTTYLEIRTGLRPLRDAPTLEGYLDVVRGAIGAVSAGELITIPGLPGPAEETVPALYPEIFTVMTVEDIRRRMREMRVNLIVSINRGSTVARAEATLKLLQDMTERNQLTAPPAVVGVDFCGNCYKNSFRDFLPVLQGCRELGLGITLHAGEKHDDEELAEMLDFAPQRLGHVVFAGQPLVDRIATLGIPLEICLSSNLVTTRGQAWSLEDHHLFKQWFCADAASNHGSGCTCGQKHHGCIRHPFSINTDDRGVFYTSMVNEWMMFAEHLRPSIAAGGSEEELRGLCAIVWQLSRDALTAAFDANCEDIVCCFDRAATAATV